MSRLQTTNRVYKRSQKQHPNPKASEGRVKSGTPWSMDLFAEGSDSTHQFKSPMVSGDRDISPSKWPRESQRAISLSSFQTSLMQGGQFNSGKSGRKSSDKGDYVANSEQSVDKKRLARSQYLVNLNLSSSNPYQVRIQDKTREFQRLKGLQNQLCRVNDEP